MNILAPINNTEEIPVLAEQGANEFFCGYVTEEWLYKYNKSYDTNSVIDKMQISINKRDRIRENIIDFKKLKRVSQEAKSNHAKLYLTLNYFYYPEEAYEQIRNLIDEVQSLEIDGFIVTDIGLINYLRQQYPSVNVILSTCQPVTNTWAAKFYRDLGVKRITFPMHMTRDEIIKITTTVPDMEYEIFAFQKKCIYDNGVCKAMHNAGNFCQDQWDYSYFSKDDFDDFNEMKRLYQNEDSFKRWTKGYASSKMKIKGWSYTGCAICALPKLLKEANITTLKLSGRSSTLEKRIEMVNFINKAIQLAQQGASIQEMEQFGGEIFGVPELCDTKERCYLASQDNY